MNSTPKPRPAWSLTNVDVERMLAVFARTVAIALAEELDRRGMVLTGGKVPEDRPARGEGRVELPDPSEYRGLDRARAHRAVASAAFRHREGCPCGCRES